MKEDFQKSRLWEKVAAGFLALFAVREAGKMVSAIISFLLFIVVFGCLFLWFVLN